MDEIRTARLLVRPPREADRTWLEWGYRLVPECRGLGYATEASRALLGKAHQLGFTFWKRAPAGGDIRNLHTLPVGQPAS